MNSSKSLVNQRGNRSNVHSFSWLVLSPDLPTHPAQEAVQEEEAGRLAGHEKMLAARAAVSAGTANNEQKVRSVCECVRATLWQHAIKLSTWTLQFLNGNNKLVSLIAARH
ncbi:hypothetical protein DUNSADRAFT_7721 [Dunaliella salina]|uniref:Encoded protein n=1 Tax=Dunaliella salina TaxID=3046 RepID=A0ABQ7GKU0_DUNSA|nr:hypothetical protein DUNSADRAFT_7721 [Dunaliella salina]|eukprot:KAF5835232.1 hypothetical protein DUNSADRAFT_7721 [Dunaliella salina]